MIYIYIGLGILLLAILFYQYIIYLKFNKISESIIKVFESSKNNFEIEIKRRQRLISIKGDKIYLIKVLFTNHNEIVITNKTTWIVYKNGKLDINNQIKGIRSFMSIDDEVSKIVVVYPYARILKYINECEMVLVDSKTDVFGSKVILYSQIKDDLKF